MGSFVDWTQGLRMRMRQSALSLVGESGDMQSEVSKQQHLLKKKDNLRLSPAPSCTPWAWTLRREGPGSGVCLLVQAGVEGRI